MNEKIKLGIVKLKALDIILFVARLHKSLGWESSNDWEKVVSHPVIKHVLAPRQAHAILELFGTLADYGIDINKIIKKLFEEYIEDEL